MIKYIKADVIFSEVKRYLSSYSEAGLIDNLDMINSIVWCNWELGLRINKPGEAILKVKKYKALIPKNFNSLNFALLCSSRTERVGFQGGVQVHVQPEELIQNCNSECSEYKGFKVIQTFHDNITYEYKTYDLLDIKGSTSRCENDCFNFNSKSRNQITLNSEDIDCNFEEGVIYFNYLTSMEDEDGNLLVVDNPLLFEFYKWRSIYDLIDKIALNKEADIVQLIKRVEQRYFEARDKARGLASMSEVEEFYALRDSLKKRNQIYYNAIMK
jgi:hypothetical protein